MKIRILVMLALMALVFALVPAASAQDDPGCFGLSAADCELIESASANSLMVSSFQQNFSIDFSITGLDMIAAMAPDAGITGDITFNVTGSGPFYVDPNSTDGIAFQATMDVNATMGTDTISGPITATLLDGVLYLEFDGRTVGIPQDSAEGMAEGLGGGALDLSGGEGATTLAEFFDIDPSELSLAGSSTGMPPSFSSLVTYERAGDDFTFFIDIGGILATDEFSMLLPIVLSSMNTEDLGLGDLSSMTEMLPMLTDALAANISVVQSVDPASNMVSGVTFDTFIDLDLGVLAGSPGALPPLVIELNFDVDLSEVGSEFAIVAPENAEMIEAEDLELFDMLGSGE